MRTIALYTRAVNIVKKKYVLCKILFCARIITRAAHSARGKKKRLQSKLQPKFLFKYFFVFHNEASDINIISRGDTADNLQRGYNKPNDCRCFFVFGKLFICLFFAQNCAGLGLCDFFDCNAAMRVNGGVFVHRLSAVCAKFIAAPRHLRRNSSRLPDYHSSAYHNFYNTQFSPFIKK